MDPVERAAGELAAKYGLTFDELWRHAMDFSLTYMRGDFERHLRNEEPDRDLLSAGEVWPSQRELDEYQEYAQRERV